MFIRHAVAFQISVQSDISFDFEMKRKKEKKVVHFKNERKRERKFEMPPTKSNGVASFGAKFQAT